MYDTRASLLRCLRLALAAGLFALLAACGSNVTLFAGTTQTEANQLLSVLLDSGIHAEKTTLKEGISISVESGQVARALNILRSRGLPHEQFDGMGQIFKKEGLVSSPVEERARYIYALSQELENTLSQIDGVLAARVHVVLPERGSVGEAATPSTAAVFIKHQAGINLDALRPQVRRLVTHAIPGLTEDRVSIIMVAAQPLPGVDANNSPALSSVLGFRVDSGSAMGLGVTLSLLVLLILLLAAGLGYVLWRYVLQDAPRSRREPSAGGQAS